MVRIVVDSILPHAESGPTDHRKDALPFTLLCDVAFWKGFGGSFRYWESEKTSHRLWIVFSVSLYQKLHPKPFQNTKVVCVFLMVVVPMLPHAGFGRNNNREYALKFLSQSYVLSEIPDRPSWWGNNVSKSTGTTWMCIFLLNSWVPTSSCRSHWFSNIISRSGRPVRIFSADICVRFSPVGP